MQPVSAPPPLGLPSSFDVFGSLRPSSTSFPRAPQPPPMYNQNQNIMSPPQGAPPGGPAVRGAHFQPPPALAPNPAPGMLHLEHQAPPQQPFHPLPPQHVPPSSAPLQQQVSCPPMPHAPPPRAPQLRQPTATGQPAASQMSAPQTQHPARDPQQGPRVTLHQAPTVVPASAHPWNSQRPPGLPTGAAAPPTYQPTPYPGTSAVYGSGPSSHAPQATGPFAGNVYAPPAAQPQLQAQQLGAWPQDTATQLARAAPPSPAAASVPLGAMSASPEFCRSTLGFAPNSVSLKLKTHVPVGYIVSPLASSTREVYDVNYGANGKVVRCFRCRAYVNPFVTWDAAGRRWICNMCSSVNECPTHYQCSLNDRGERIDRMERPELRDGTVEFIAPSDYMLRPPQPPTIMFLIDVSYPAVASGLVLAACQGIKSAVSSGKIPGGPRTQFGIMTFDATIHFYEISAEKSQPHMVVVSSLDDVFVPVPDGVLNVLVECQKEILALLDKLPTMWQSRQPTTTSPNCAGSAMRAAQAAMSKWGGKMVVFLSSPPTIGDPTSHRSGGSSSSSADAQLFKPRHDGFKNLSVSMSNSQICVDLFICPPPTGSSMASIGDGCHTGPSSVAKVVSVAHFDLATIIPLSQQSAGEVHYFPDFNALVSGDKIRNDILLIATRNIAWEAVMRIRVSRGWKITNWFGHFQFRHMDLCILPNCHEHQTFAINLELEDNVSTEPALYFQAALLYTNSHGERRIRVHTHGIRTTQSFNEIMGSVDESAVATILGHQAIEQAMKTSIVDARQFLQIACSKICGSMMQTRGHGADFPSSWCLKLLGLLKSPCFRDDRNNDYRLYHWQRYSAVPIHSLELLMQPQLFKLHEAASLTAEGASTTPLLPLTAQSLSESGVFLLNTGFELLIWIGRATNPAVLQQIFGCHDPRSIHPQHADSLIGSSGSLLGARAAQLVTSLRNYSPSFLKLTIIQQGSPSEILFYSGLVEDRCPGLLVSYQEFLHNLGSSLGFRPSLRMPQ